MACPAPGSWACGRCAWVAFGFLGDVVAAVWLVRPFDRLRTPPWLCGPGRTGVDFLGRWCMRVDGRWAAVWPGGCCDEGDLLVPASCSGGVDGCFAGWPRGGLAL